MHSIIALILLAAAVPAAAQVSMGAEVGPEAFMRSGEPKPDTSGEEAFSWALSSEVSSSTLYAVFGSTSPEREMFKYLRKGFYRQELASVLLLSEKTSVPFSKLAAEMPKAGGLAGLAKKYKQDAMALFEAGGSLKAEADTSLPLFLSISSSSAPAEVRLSTAAGPSNEKK